jgi:peptide/nickel transport system permease protein
MFRFVVGRFLSAVPTLLIVAVTVFLLLRLIPGDPAMLMLGDLSDPEQLEAMRRSMGLDRSIPVQFAIWLERVFSGDLGTSISNGEAVLPLILKRFGVSASIVLTSVALAALIAVPGGIFAAWRHNRLADLLAVTTATLLLSIPSFWLGLILLLIFGLKLGWFPVIGFVSLSEYPLRAIYYMTLPVATLVLVEIGIIIRMTRASALEVLRLDYITHARSKGLPERLVLWRHAFPNAFAPTLTLIGLILGNLLGGIAVIETVFTIPGLGRLLVDGIFARDYPVIQGCLLFIAIIYVVVNMMVDLLYPIFDPRVTQ